MLEAYCLFPLRDLITLSLRMRKQSPLENGHLAMKSISGDDFLPNLARNDLDLIVNIKGA